MAKRRKLNATDVGTSATENLPPSSRLLALPAELRRTIYTYAVVEPNDVELGEHSDNEPGLLRTCRQVREEASPIFYKKNRFVVDHPDWKTQPQASHWFWEKTWDRKTRAYGQLNWANIKEKARFLRDKGSLEGATEESLSAYDANDPNYSWLFVLAKVYTIVRKLQGVDWEVVEGVLDTYKEGINIKTSS